MSDIHLYRIWDNEREEYWSDLTGRSVWRAKSPLVQAWNRAHRNWHKPKDSPKFKDQVRYEAHTFELKRIY
jgi:hypothetical protein